ncbi:hypothetical protein H6P81_016560 [Aristolochia fimbriata]|uniref:Uncharacterized protein n=1 Tax=Aristolochia fimbriata TaxID=158543 RepID=A0AAV7E8N2_ARIFI|nr:hypothetical protein H6P81_016560 [Aristolochia fimbriata]
MAMRRAGVLLQPPRVVGGPGPSFDLHAWPLHVHATFWASIQGAHWPAYVATCAYVLALVQAPLWLRLVCAYVADVYLVPNCTLWPTTLMFGATVCCYLLGLNPGCALARVCCNLCLCPCAGPSPLVAAPGVRLCGRCLSRAQLHSLAHNPNVWRYVMAMRREGVLALLGGPGHHLTCTRGPYLCMLPFGPQSKARIGPRVLQLVPMSLRWSKPPCGCA